MNREVKKSNMMEYKTSEQNDHHREEYLQWARILSRGNPVHGMLLVFVQKLCTAFHEFEPAWRSGVLNEQALDHFRARLAARTQTVLDTLVENGLGATAVAGDFERLLESVDSARVIDELAKLEETTHALNHTLCDWLEKTY